MKKTPLLIHACCAPCMSYVYELFAESHSITVFYYNPNIAPRPEYDKRLMELQRFAQVKGFSLVLGEYNIDDWTERVWPHRSYGERSERCWECYRMRLEGSFKKASELGIGAVTTTLSVSPHKDAAMINRIGEDLKRSHGIEFVEGDFKKRNGYKRSVELSRAYGFFRQNYCGCIYSKRERDEKTFGGREASF
jgi:predicted adenine nucleotide alpha hydrolase (AANH) superfamily ATPase